MVAPVGSSAQITIIKKTDTFEVATPSEVERTKLRWMAWAVESLEEEMVSFAWIWGFGSAGMWRNETVKWDVSRFNGPDDRLKSLLFR